MAQKLQHAAREIDLLERMTEGSAVTKIVTSLLRSELICQSIWAIKYGGNRRIVCGGIFSVIRMKCDTIREV